MSIIGLILGLGYLVFAAWLTLKLLRLFLGPLSQISSAGPTQIFVTDYYVLLGEIALFTLPFLGEMNSDVSPVLLPIFIALLGFCWFGITRTLSRARIRSFAPRMLGQILFPFQVAVAAGYAVLSLPLLIGMLFGGAPIAIGAIFAFVFLFTIFSRASRLIACRAEPLENSEQPPNHANELNVPPAV